MATIPPNSALSIITNAYDLAGVKYVIRERNGESGGRYHYLVLCAEHTRAEYENEDLDTLLRQRGFMEFLDGKIASY